MRKAFTFIELLVVLAIIGILASIPFPVFARTRCGNARLSSCQSNLKQIVLSFKQYAGDYDQTFPLLQGTGSANSVFGWADAIAPYLKNPQIFQCPSEKNTRIVKDPTKIGYTDYWMNVNLAGKKATQMERQAQTILSGDGQAPDEITDARYHLRGLSAAWRTDELSPAFRHGDVANYAFVDGHVKWLKPKKISNASLEPSVFSFVIRVLENQSTRDQKS